MSGRKSTRILSFDGMPCPMAIGQLAQVLPTLGIGDTVEVRTDDPGAVADFPAWARRAATSCCRSSSGRARSGSSSGGGSSPSRKGL